MKGKKNCLIDTGTLCNLKDITNFCEGNGVVISDLGIIINTHCHPNHIGLNSLLKKISRLIYMLIV